MSSHSTKFILLIYTAFVIALFADPVLANKFQTIGSGVSGEFKIKIEYLRIFAYVVSGLFMLFSLLSVITKKNNAHDLNYTAWKLSATIFFVLALVALFIAILL